MWEKTYQKPLRLDCRNRSDVVLGREHEFIVQNPFSFKAKDGRGVQKNVLVVLDGHVLVLALGFLLGDLHEKSGTQCAPDVFIIALVFKGCRNHFEF